MFITVSKEDLEKALENLNQALDQGFIDSKAVFNVDTVEESKLPYFPSIYLDVYESAETINPAYNYGVGSNLRKNFHIINQEIKPKNGN